MKIPTGAVLRDEEIEESVVGFHGNTRTVSTFPKIDLDMERLAEFSSKQVPGRYGHKNGYTVLVDEPHPMAHIRTPKYYDAYHLLTKVGNFDSEFGVVKLTAEDCKRDDVQEALITVIKDLKGVGE